MADDRTLEETLAALRQALCDGNYLALPDMIRVIEQGIAAIDPADQARLAALRGEARRTAGAARAALHGLRAGQRRISELMRLEAGFLSYGAGGGQETALRQPGLIRQL